MASFSWSDTARAVFGSCLPCLPSSRRHDTADDDRQHRGRRDELESLLQGAEYSDAEMDTDALSLHSRLGQQDRRRRSKKKRVRNKGSITLCGFDLFGRPLSHSAEDDDGDAEHESHHRISRISSSTLDSDASPLADDAIADLSTQTQARREAQEAREARKARKRTQKLAKTLGQQDHAFEGFPGSGPPQDEFGAFQQAQPSVNGEVGFVNVEGGGPNEVYRHVEADADFDAESYDRTAAPRSDSGSGTRSRTSASVASNTAQPMLADQFLQPPSSPVPVAQPQMPKAKRSKRSKKSGKSSVTTTSSSPSQPRSPTDATHIPRIGVASPTFEGFPEDEGFEGVPPGADVAHPSPLKFTGESVHGGFEGNFASSRGLPSPGPSDRFPSPSLGRPNEFPSLGLGGRKNSLNLGGKGAFLARTGDDA